MRLVLGLLLSFVALYPHGAYAEKEKCPEGCFCLHDGEYEPYDYSFDSEWCNSHQSQVLKLESNAGSFICNVEILGSNMSPAVFATHTYYLSEFSVFYHGEYGGYGFKNGEFLYIQGCRSTSDRGNEYYDYIFQCPYHFPNSAKGSKSLGDCFKYDINGNKIYYGSEQKIVCNEGHYLPVGATSCKSCDASKNHICPGGRFEKSEIKNQGLKIQCNPGEFLPANATECSACETEYYQCMGGVYDASEMQDQGRNPIQTNGYVPGGDRPFIVCQPGFYVPANTTTCTARTGNYICLGGIFYADVQYDSDRGATTCNYGNANETHTKCIGNTTQPSKAFTSQKSANNINSTPFPTNNPTSYSITDKTTTDTNKESATKTDTEKQIPLKQLSESNVSPKGFDWANLNIANLFKSSVNAKSALPETSRASRSTQARSVANNVNRKVPRNASQNSRQSATIPQVPRPTSGKNKVRNTSNTVSRRTK